MPTIRSTAPALGPITAAIEAEFRRRGWTQQQLAARSGVPQPKISRLLSGLELARSDTLERLMAALDLEVRPREAAPTQP